ncbi:MAG TPA: MBL fold metallo-hydrolase [Dermatophilaceae bacterium]|nr:MBL fold metallo-hydrolase [Dermatophilaceae bacterium]
MTVIGCSGSFAGPDSASSSYLVQAPHEGRTASILLDLGSGALGTLQRHLDLDTLDAVLVSHLHPDHCVDLLGLYVSRRYRPGGAPDARLPVWGPAATSERLSLMYHGIDDDGLAGEFDVRVLTDRVPLSIGPFTVTPYAVRHPVQTYGFRVQAGEAVLAYTGDTDSCAALGPLLTGAGLAVTDCAFVDGRDDSRGIHLTGSRAAEAAVAAGGVRRLMLSHIPPWNDPEECRKQAETVWTGAVEVARPDVAYDL